MLYPRVKVKNRPIFFSLFSSSSLYSFLASTYPTSPAIISPAVQSVLSTRHLSLNILFFFLYFQHKHLTFQGRMRNWHSPHLW